MSGRLISSVTVDDLQTGGLEQGHRMIITHCPGGGTASPAPKGSSSP